MPRAAPTSPAFPDKLVDDFTRMIWMGLDGRQDDLERYVRRVLPKWEPEMPGLAGRLAQLLEPRAAGGVVRRVMPPAKETISDASDAEFAGAAASSPAADFLRIEMPVSLATEPIWPSDIHASLDELLRERRMVKHLQKAGLHPTRTVVFTGPPGVGKTLAARWLARELNLPLATLNLGAVMSSFLGRTGANIRQVMDFTRSRPCVFLLDELDAIAKRRDDPSDIGELKRLVTVLLQEIDLWPGSGLMIATTNHEQLIDPAVWRRFERRIVFPLPGETDQLKLLQQHLGDSWNGIEAKSRRAIGVISSHLSQAELTLIAQRALRDQILGIRTLKESLETHLASVAAAMPLPERKILGTAMKRLGLGQREIHRLTGLARETLRKSDT
jgi:MoxR-like ATPase